MNKEYKGNFESTDIVNKYFKDLRHSSLISVDEEIELANKISDGDENAVTKLVEANLKFVVSIAKGYQGLGLSLSDLISEGNYGLVRAARKFDVTRGFRFISYAVYWIKQAIIQSLNDNSRTIRLPTNIINKIIKLNKEINEGSFNEVDYPYTVSLNEIIKTDSNSSGAELESFVADESSDKFEIFEIDSDKLKETINDTLSILGNRERDIIECYFGLNPDFEPMTLEVIGDRYELTKERVRQIKEKAIRRLRHESTKLFDLFNR